MRVVWQVVPVGQPPLLAPPGVQSCRHGEAHRPNLSRQMPDVAPAALLHSTPCATLQSESAEHTLQPTSTKHSAPGCVCTQKPERRSSPGVDGSRLLNVKSRHDVPLPQSASPPKQESVQYPSPVSGFEKQLP